MTRVSGHLSDTALSHGVLDIPGCGVFPDRRNQAYGPWARPMVLLLGASQAAPARDSPINEACGVSGGRQLSVDWLIPMNTADRMRAIASEKNSTARAGIRPR